MNKCHPAFSTPIYRDLIKLDKSVLNPALKKIDFKRIDTDDRFHSTDYKVLDNQLSFLKSIVQKVLKTMLTII